MTELLIKEKSLEQVNTKLSQMILQTKQLIFNKKEQEQKLVDEILQKSQNEIEKIFSFLN
jgi:hypothetical protein